jgi:hypothetical protein
MTCPELLPGNRESGDDASRFRILYIMTTRARARDEEMNLSKNRVWLMVVAFAMFGAGAVVGCKHLAQDTAPVGDASFQTEMDAYCTAALNDKYLSKLSADDRKGENDTAFFSRKLHTCVHVNVTSDLKNPATTKSYVVSDLTDGFTAPPKWHHSDSPLHVYQTNYGRSHHLSVEGSWLPVSDDPGQKPVADANVVKLTCDYTEGTRTDDETNMCTETEGYTQFGNLQTDTQTFHIASWASDEVIATDAEKGLTGSTTTTLLIHPNANQVEIVDRTRMKEKQPDLFKGAEGKSFGDHYELHGGMYLWDTQGVFFQCGEDGVTTDMRFEVVQRHHGDVVDVPRDEWNAAAKAGHKYTSHECEAALQNELAKLH